MGSSLAVEIGTLAQANWIAQTRLHPPSLSGDVIARLHLLAALRDALTTCTLTLLSAPAGYGKTTLLAHWKDEGDSRVAWLSLDEDDNDPVRFLTALILSLRCLNPACGAAAQTLLASMPNPGAHARQIAGALINDILETLPDPFVLILDDLHRITAPATFLALNYLLERLPPQMRVVMASRHDPPLSLARLRARGQLAELRLPDLRFTLAEATAFLNDTLHLGLAPADLSSLHARTEGWAVGLRLLAGSLDSIATPADRAAFIANFAHTDRFVFDFLADEVLNRQSETVRAFLLETAILPELTAALCQAVTGREDAATILEDLNRRNLFVIAMSETKDEGGRRKDESAPSSFIPHPSSFRYHALFTEFLNQRLSEEMPERVAELHRRAAQGETTADRVIAHYLAARMWVPAAEVMEQSGKRLRQQGMLATVDGWIRALPPAIRDARPRVVLLWGACALEQGDPATAQARLERAVQDFETSGDEPGLGEALASLATCLFLRGDFLNASRLIPQALEHPLAPPARIQMLMARASLALFSTDHGPALSDLETARRAVEEARTPEAFMFLAFYLKPFFFALPGALPGIERFCDQAAARAGDSVSPLRSAVEELLSSLHLWRGRLEEALRVGESALAMQTRLGGHPFLGLNAAATVAVTAAARGDYATAERGCKQLLQIASQQQDQIPIAKTLMPIVLYLVGRIYWLQNRLDEARQISAQMAEETTASSLPEPPGMSMLRLIMRGLIEMGERRFADAEQTFRAAVEIEEQIPVFIVYASARVALAHLYLEWKRPQAALAELEPVLAASEQQGIPGMILKEGSIVIPLLRLAIAHGAHAAFAAELLGRLGIVAEPAPARVPETGEMLTPREVEILRLIAAGYSNREIAERLVVSEPTVKTHVAHILQKLNVSSRTQAAARARDLDRA